VKKVDYIIALTLVVLGLACLTMSGSYLLEPNLAVYAMTFIKVCIWIGIPIAIVGLVYFFIIKKRRGEEKK
jgi:hypothetical protein